MNANLPFSSGGPWTAASRGTTSAVGIRSLSEGTPDPPGTVQDIEQLQIDADKSADVLDEELKRCTEEYRALTARMESTLASLGLNQAELREKAKCYATASASVRQAGRSQDPEDEIRFADEVLNATANARAERVLAAEVRNVRNRSRRLADEIACLEQAVRNAVQLEISDACKAKEWQAEAARFQEKAKVLRKQIDDLSVPSQAALEKRYEEYEKLKAKVLAEQKYLQRFDGLPPSLVEASEKLNAAKQELLELRSKLRNNYQLQF